MHVNNYTVPRPPEHILEQCIQVLIPMSPKISYREMKRWCRDNDTSYIWCELVDTSDIDYDYDHIAAFWFIEEQDAVMFTLKFK